jgi:hypothetical protein
LLRREGLYSSHLTHWRQQRDRGLAPHRRGPKPKHDPLFEEVRKLKQENGQLTQPLASAELIIDVQKKVSSLLGIPLATIDNDESTRRRPRCTMGDAHRPLRVCGTDRASSAQGIPKMCNPLRW